MKTLKKMAAVLGLVGLLGMTSPAIAAKKFYDGGGYKEGQLIRFQRADDMKSHSERPYPFLWSTYSGSSNENRPTMDFSDIPEVKNAGIRIEYCTPKGAWEGMYDPIDADLSGSDGIKISAKGSGEFKIQITEGYSDYGACLGEIYEVTIKPESEWWTYEIPWNKFKKAGFQHTEKELGFGGYTRIDKLLFNNNLDLNKIHSPAIEFLSNNSSTDNKDSLEIKNISFYKNHDGDKK